MREWRSKNKEAISIRNKEYWSLHPEAYRAKELRHREKRKPKVKEYRKIYRLRNLEVLRRKNREWQQRKRLHRREYMKDYYLKHSTNLRRRSAQYYQDNPGKHSIHTIKRRAKEADCPLSEISVINAWMREIRHSPFVRCHWCGTKVRCRKIHFDHVVALAKGGKHSISNLCASCSDCNMEKHSRCISDWIVRGQRFLNL